MPEIEISIRLWTGKDDAYSRTQLSVLNRLHLSTLLIWLLKMWSDSRNVPLFFRRSTNTAGIRGWFHQLADTITQKINFKWLKKGGGAGLKKKQPKLPKCVSTGFLPQMLHVQHVASSKKSKTSKLATYPVHLRPRVKQAGTCVWEEVSPPSSYATSPPVLVVAPSPPSS